MRPPNSVGPASTNGGYPFNKAPQGGKMSTEEVKGPYKGAYKEEVFKEDEAPDEATLEEQSTKESESEDEETISLSDPKEINHDYKKRYDDLKKHYDVKLNEWKQEKEDLVSQTEYTVSGQGTVEVEDEADDTDLAHFKDNYPDVYNVVEAISSKKTEKLHAEIDRLSRREEQLQVKGAYQELLALHSDFPEIKKSKDFLEWLELQPPNISEGIAKNNTDVKWASRVLDLYKADKGLNKKRGRPKTEAAAEVVTKTRTKTVSTNPDANKKVWSSSEIRSLKPHEYEKYESEIDQARLDGRIVNG